MSIGKIASLIVCFLLAVSSQANADLVHQWTFNGDANDIVGNADGSLINGALVDPSGRLLLNGVNQYMRSAPIDNTIVNKTLVSWVSLTDLNQQGGSAITLENPTGGDIFDSITYGERTQKQWMNGSNAFQRTPMEDNGGMLESVTEPGEVMIAISYGPGGAIDIYRDRAPYASYTTGGPVSYPAGVADVLIGKRHLDHPNASSYLAGYVNEARVYDTALNAAEILAIPGPETAPNPISMLHQWTFNGDTQDSVGTAHGTLGGGSSLGGGRVSFNGIDGQMATAPINQTITAKTLVSWVSLNDLDQPGGGSALSLQQGGGGRFDGIVYAELDARRWMSGSNGHQRSQSVGGPAETVTEPGEVMTAIVYDTDNSITIYRDGVPYGSPYVKGGLQTYDGGVANAIFGRRHDGSNKPLNGVVNEARIYGGALGAGQILDIMNEGPVPYVPPPVPPMLHQWTFNGDARDQVGSAHGVLLNGASVDGDTRLALDGIDDYMHTLAIGNSIGEKTLVSWVSLDNLAQRSGSALTLENSSGVPFDGIVFGERTPQQWMSGSEGYVRSNGIDNGGAAEGTTEPGTVMISISYSAGGQITIYQNDALYATYAAGGPVSYVAGVSDVLIGLRHLSASGQVGDATGNDAYLAGFVEEARIYGGAMNTDQIADVFIAGPSLDPNPEPPGPELVHQWTFEDGTFNDSVGTAHGTPTGGAQIVGGRLQLDGIDDYMRTTPIDETISAKTLVSWVSLDNLAQRSGSALTLQHPGGSTISGDGFDGIVLGEQVAGQWMSGSDYHLRSLSPGGVPVETVTEPGEVMIAIVYGEDSSITIYRDGVPYANASKGNLFTFPAGLSDVIIGRRHIGSAAGGTADGNDAFLAGFVNEARIYNGALGPQDIQDIFNAGAVPEPSTCLLLVVGLAGLLAFGRRRR